MMLGRSLLFTEGLIVGQKYILIHSTKLSHNVLRAKPFGVMLALLYHLGCPLWATEDLRHHVRQLLGIVG